VDTIVGVHIASMTPITRLSRRPEADTYTESAVVLAEDLAATEGKDTLQRDAVATWT